MKDKAPQHLVLATIDEEARPLSIRVLGAYAESLGIKTTLLVVLHQLAAFGQPVEFSAREIRALARFLDRARVTHLGFYLMTASLKPYRALAKALRAAGYRGVIMAGGVHPTLCPLESLAEEADFAVQGAGELPLKMILEGATVSAQVLAAPGQQAGGVHGRSSCVIVHSGVPCGELHAALHPHTHLAPSCPVRGHS